jgi:hypothetical protein
MVHGTRQKLTSAGGVDGVSKERRRDRHPTDPLQAFEANLELYAGNAPARRDGWTPFARRLFLEVVAETGIVSRACAYAGLSERSAYNLRNRDPLFAAGWDAADLLARDPLANGLREQAAEGIIETITRNGEVVATRHRFDGRLSMAVLHRLDKRCDRAAERGGAHLALVRHWDEWLTLVGNGEEQERRWHCSNPHATNPRLTRSRSTVNFVNFPRAKILQPTFRTRLAWRIENPAGGTNRAAG